MKRFLAVITAILFSTHAYADSLGSAAGGTAANQSSLNGCIVNASSPTLTSGQQVGVQCDVNGNVKTTSTGGSLPTGAATSANQPTNSAQGATTAGQTGNLEQRATLTGAAVYVNGTTNPAINDVNGSDPVTLRDPSGVAVPLTTPVGIYQTYPSGATQVSVSSGNVAAATATASMPAVVGQTNYVSGFIVTAAGATAGSDVTVTLAGIAGGTMSFTFTFPLGAVVPATPLMVQFQTPLAASATNTAITLSVPSGGIGNTNCTANIWGRVQ